MLLMRHAFERRCCEPSQEGPPANMKENHTTYSQRKLRIRCLSFIPNHLSPALQTTGFRWGVQQLNYYTTPASGLSPVKNNRSISQFISLQSRCWVCLGPHNPATTRALQSPQRGVFKRKPTYNAKAIRQPVTTAPFRPLNDRHSVQDAEDGRAMVTRQSGRFPALQVSIALLRRRFIAG